MFTIARGVLQRAATTRSFPGRAAVPGQHRSQLLGSGRNGCTANSTRLPRPVFLEHVPCFMYHVGQEPAKGRTATAIGARTPRSCCAPPSRREAAAPKKLPGCSFSGPQWGNCRKRHFGGSKKCAEGAKKTISGGEKNQVVGQPHAGAQKNDLRQDWGRKNHHGGRKNQESPKLWQHRRNCSLAQAVMCWAGEGYLSSTSRIRICYFIFVFISTICSMIKFQSIFILVLVFTCVVAAVWFQLIWMYSSSQKVGTWTCRNSKPSGLRKEENPRT